MIYYGRQKRLQIDFNICYFLEGKYFAAEYYYKLVLWCSIYTRILSYNQLLLDSIIVNILARLNKSVVNLPHRSAVYLMIFKLRFN